MSRTEKILVIATIVAMALVLVWGSVSAQTVYIFVQN